MSDDGSIASTEPSEQSVVLTPGEIVQIAAAKAFSLMCQVGDNFGGRVSSIARLPDGSCIAVRLHRITENDMPVFVEIEETMKLGCV